MRTLLTTTMLLCLSIGCSSVGVTHLKDAPERERGCELEIFSEPSMVKRPYEEVCLLDSRTGSTAFHEKTAAAAINNARRPACQCGADAIIVQGMGTQGASFNSWGNGTAIMKAIRFTDAK